MTWLALTIAKVKIALATPKQRNARMERVKLRMERRSFPPRKNENRAKRSARPERAIPITYKMNVAEKAVFSSLIFFWISEG